MKNFPTLSYIACSKLPSRAYIFARLSLTRHPYYLIALLEQVTSSKGTQPFRTEHEVIASSPPGFRRTSWSLTDLMPLSRSGTVLTQTQVACFYLYSARQGEYCCTTDTTYNHLHLSRRATQDS